MSQHEVNNTRRNFIKGAAALSAAAIAASAGEALARADEDAALQTARAIEHLQSVSPYDLTNCTVVDMILDASERLGVEWPEAWMMAAKRGEGVEELAAWFRRLPPTFSLRDYDDAAAEEYRVALRVIRLAEIEHEREGEGWNFLIEHVDEVTTNGADGLCPNPDSQFFVPVFVAAVRDIGRDHRAYVALKDLLAEVDAGADLDALAEGREADDDRRAAERLRAELDAPEPADRTSREWRVWKLRRFERDIAGWDGAAPNDAGYEFDRMLRRVIELDIPLTDDERRSVFSTLLVAQQREWKGGA